MKGIGKLLVFSGAAVFGTATSIIAYRYRSCKTTADVKHQFSDDKQIVVDLSQGAKSWLGKKTCGLRNRAMSAYRGFRNPQNAA